MKVRRQLLVNTAAGSGGGEKDPDDDKHNDSNGEDEPPKSLDPRGHGTSRTHHRLLGLLSPARDEREQQRGSDPTQLMPVGVHRCCGFSLGRTCSGFLTFMLSG